MTDDPFERAAAREQEIRRERLAKREQDAIRAPRRAKLVFLALWAVGLLAHLLLASVGRGFVVHATVYAVFVVMLLAPFFSPVAIWAALLFGHWRWRGWGTGVKLDLVAFLAFAVLMVYAWFPSRSRSRSPARWV